MNFQDRLDGFRFQYWSELEANYANDGIIDWERVEDSPRVSTFYDYLLACGFNRFQLSAHGIGRNVSA